MIIFFTVEMHCFLPTNIFIRHMIGKAFISLVVVMSFGHDRYFVLFIHSSHMFHSLLRTFCSTLTFFLLFFSPPLVSRKYIKLIFVCFVCVCFILSYHRNNKGEALTIILNMIHSFN